MAFPPQVLVVEAAVDPAVEAAWNRWYNAVHLPEITAGPGFRQSARYVAEQESVRHYIAIYEVDSPDALTSAEFQRRRGWADFAGRVTWTSRLYRRIAANPAG